MITELEFKSLASEGYNRIPLMVEAFADLETPLSLYLKLAHTKDGGKHSFLLESVVGGERFGRYSFIGLPARTLLRQPRHPYTRALLQSRADGALAKGQRLVTIAGAPPDLAALPNGCAFATRCKLAQSQCELKQPDVSWLEDNHSVRCLRALEPQSV